MNKSTTFNLIDERTRAHCIGRVSMLETDNKWMVKIEPFKKGRSLAQNRLSFLWYRFISENIGYTKQETRRYCKLEFGIPILIESSEDFNKSWTRIADSLDYEQQLEAMDFIEVTRFFKVSEFAEYLNDMEIYYADVGIPLPHPEDLYYEALRKAA